MIQVGQVLDKYELLERVGQGGMAVVYRGLDRSLKRTVAIKVLHKHLSDYQEARDRFEREAQAVAKLRHENILEIFDYSAQAGAESYIVTEFIEGQTLKQLVTDRPIAYPEIGAMVILQVARALAHAHAAGILHRDIKPENIMVRSDGVVKLMDFGISHMVDLERLTVTGQLLGSPAYMAPEHVEGRPLDFRTDVFAVGIVLYQLTVGKLPFEGKNPHEVLKRIAECRFVDPRIATPRIGNRLGKIILRAMAAQPGDRYPAISEMVLAISAYLEESGLDAERVDSELARYFTGPAAYEQALHHRLVAHLSQRGQQLLSGGEQAAALDVFDRVLTIDPENEKVLGILDGLNRRARFKTASIGALAIGAIALGGYLIHVRARPPAASAPPSPEVEVTCSVQLPVVRVQPVEPAPAALDAGVDSTSDGNAAAVGSRPPAAGNATATLDAGAPATATQVRVIVSPARGSELKVGDQAWARLASDSGEEIRTLDRDVRIAVRNPCCEEADQLVRLGQGEVYFSLRPLPAKLIALCDARGDVSVRINGKAAKLGETVAEPFDRNATQLTRTFAIEFAGEHVDGTPIARRVAANQTETVRCVAR